MQKIDAKRIPAGLVLMAATLLLVACTDESPNDTGKSAASISMRSPMATRAGDPTSDVTSATMGPAGGALSAPNGGIVLAIPSGALTSDTTIGIRPLTNMAPGGLGDGYRLTPDGQTFERPIQVTIPYGDLDLMGTPAEALGIATQTATGHWQLIEDAVVDEQAETVTVTTAHLSDYSLVEGFQIRPYYREVSPGEQVEIKVVYCYRRDEVKLFPVPESDDELAPLVTPEHDDELTPLGEVVKKIRCDMDDDPAPLLPIPDVLAWKVNGVEGGDSEVGMIAKRNLAVANYIAPSVSPDPDTVTVSADLPWGKKGKVVATALIQITEPGRTYEGNLRYSFSRPEMSMTLSGDAIWLEGDPGADRFDASGKMNFSVAAECSRIDEQGQLRRGEAKFEGAVGFEGEMSFDVPEEGRYTFTIGTNWDDAPLVCNGIAQPSGVLLVSPMCDFTPDNASFVGDGQLLAGSSKCDDGQTELEWSFARTK